jgi:hypothetical protein
LECADSSRFSRDDKFLKSIPASSTEEGAGMSRMTLNLLVGVVTTMATVGSAYAGDSRVRTDNPALAAVIQDGIRRSATFRGIVEAIDASDGIVFVEEGRCGHGARACLALSVKQAGPSRLLRVVVDVKKADWDLIGSIGHELYHAVEVLSDRSVNSTSEIYLFYRRAGETSGDRFETPAAINAGDAVRREARQANRR